MVMSESLSSALTQAQDVLSKYDRLSQAITAGVLDLSPKIESRLLCEKQLRAAIVTEATQPTEATHKAVAKAKAGVEGAIAALDEAARKLAALRGGQAQLGGPLAEAHATLASELPGHNAALIEEFSQEWNAALNKWNAVLAKRHAVEQLVGRKLQLPEPTAAVSSAPDLGDRGRPGKLLINLKGKLDELRSVREMRSWTPMPRPYGMPPKLFNPDAVYVLVKAWDKFAVGAKLVESSVEVNRLRWLCDLDHAVLMDDPSEATGLQAADTALKSIQKAELQQQEERRKGEQARLDNQPQQEGVSKVRDQQLAQVLPEVEDGAPVPQWVDAKSGKPSGPPNVR